MRDAKSESIPEDTYEALIHATLTALYKKGYVNLRVRDIDAEFEKSRQLIHHYFSGKDELVTETLSYLVEAIDDELDSTTEGDPAKKLNEEIDSSLLGSNQDNGDHLVVMTALYELQSQAQHNPHQQELFIRLADRLIDHFREIIQDGIDQGVFNDVDALQMATAIDNFITGAQMKKIHLGQDNAPSETREIINELVISRLNPTPEENSPN